MLTSKWSVLGLLFFVRTSIGFQFQSVASAAATFLPGAPLTATQVGSLIGLYLLPGFAVALPSGVLTARLPDKLSTTLALVIMAAGSAMMSLAPDYLWAAFGRLVEGAGFALLNLVLTKMVASWFADRQTPVAMGVLLASWPCGIAIALATQPGLALTDGWRTVMMMPVIVCLGLAAATILLYRPPRAEAAEPRRLVRAMPTRVETIRVAFAGLAWGGLNVGLVIFFSFAPQVITGTGMASVEAAAIVSIGLWVSAISTPLGGMVVERLGRPDLHIALGCALAAGVLLALPSGAMPIVLCVLIGISIGPPATAIMAMPVRALNADSRSIGLGIFYLSYFSEMAVGPAIAGYVADKTGTPNGALWFGAAAFASSVLATMLFAMYGPRAGRSTVQPMTEPHS